MEKLSSQLVISRLEYEKLTHAGLRNGELNFVSSLIDSWLASYPNDLPSTLLNAKVLFLKRRNKEAIQCLTNVLVCDPEFLQAYMLLSDIGGNVDEKAVKSFMFILGGTTLDISSIYPWAVTLRAVRMGIRRGDLNNIEKLLTGLLENEPNNPLVALSHCQYLIRKNDVFQSFAIVQQYLEKWPECIQFSLILADLKMQDGEESEAINLLHQCVSKDPSGQVLRRMFGEKHEFCALWDQNQKIYLDIPIPSSVGVALEWNKLNTGNFTSNHHGPEEISIQSTKNGREENKKVNSRKNINAGGPSIIPVYVILSTRSGLETKYGKKTAQIIIEELYGLSRVFGQKKKWESLVFLPDDPQNIKSEEIQPVTTIDPWKIKLALNDLDKTLRIQSRMIGAVVIAGGHGVVPFHKLPNPTDDSDDGVLSDNPYSTSSSNYFLPEWPVGRLPDEAGKDAGLLLEQIRQVTEYHKNSLTNINPLTRFFTAILDRTEIRRVVRDMISPPKNFGYSAAVWRRSSLSAFRPIGAGSSLRITPPFLAENIDVENLMKSKCAYFNLHGLSNSPEWYGQRDFSEAAQGADFPVAITTKEIKKYRNNVDLTFTEACYGGYVVEKKIDDSIALKLISIGSQALVASTCIAYGSVFPPLIGADLLAFIFWKYIKDGYSFGESLMQAKIGLVKVMSQRQGYLDGEDQKTLESFVLYGDPMGYLEKNIYLEKRLPEKIKPSDLSTSFTDKNGIITNSPRISKQVLSEINELVESYIPNLEDAKIKIREHQIRLDKMSALIGTKKGNGNNELNGRVGTRTQVTYSQKLKSARLIHEQFARVTLDETGMVIKLAVSR